MPENDEINFKEVISGQQKVEYVDQLEVLREKLNSGSFLKSRSSKKELIEIVENLIDILPVEMRTARWQLLRIARSCSRSKYFNKTG